MEVKAAHEGEKNRDHKKIEVLGKNKCYGIEGCCSLSLTQVPEES